MKHPSPDCLARASRISLLCLDVDGVLTDGRLYYGSGELELKTFHTRDGLGIKMLMSVGIEVAIITARNSEIVSRRAAELGISHCCQGSSDKRARLRALLDSLALPAEQAGFMGDDLPDLVAMREAGLALTVPDAAEAVRASAHWQSCSPGGQGAVREACEMILRARGDLEDAIRRFSMQEGSA